MNLVQELSYGYEFHNSLERNDIAELWEATNRKNGRPYILKIPSPTLLHIDPIMLMQEMQPIESLSHQNIAQCSAGWVSTPKGQHPYLVMSYIEGITLAELIKSGSGKGTLATPAILLGLLRPICSALNYAHQQGVIHGNLTPGNILLDRIRTSLSPVGEPMLTDFGLLRIFRPTTIPLNYAYYLSPEQAQGFFGNNLSDLYALGVILYELCTGMLPFQGSDATALMNQHIYKVPAAPSSINPSIPSALDRVIRRSLAKSPNDRFSSAAEMLNAVEVAFGKPANPVLIDQDITLGRTGNAPQIQPYPPVAITPSQAQRTGQASLEDTPLPVPVRRRWRLPAHIQPVKRRWNPHPPSSQVQQQPPLPPPPFPLPPPQPSRRPGRTRFLITLIAAVILLLVLIGSGLAYFNFFQGPPPVIGQAFFYSSGLLNPNNANGTDDQIHISLQVPPPPAGYAYFAWLMGTKQAPNIVSLGQLLPGPEGTYLLTYQDPKAMNLLKSNSRLLITLEPATPAPLTPSLDHANWVYAASYSEVPYKDPSFGSHASLYDHILHLLAYDPQMVAVGLNGGLVTWLFKNSEKIVEWTSSLRDASQKNSPDAGAFIRRQLIRIVDYLDGVTVVPNDLPTYPILVDKTFGRIGLIKPESSVLLDYLAHIEKHLTEIYNNPYAGENLRMLATNAKAEVDSIAGWLGQGQLPDDHDVYNDAIMLLRMTDTDLGKPNVKAKLNDMALNANYTLVGQVLPDNNQVLPGVIQLYYDIQRLATFEIRACTTSNPCFSLSSTN